MISGSSLSGLAFLGITTEGTWIQDVLIDGSRAAGASSAAFKSISELPCIEPLQSPSMCMVTSCVGVLRTGLAECGLLLKYQELVKSWLQKFDCAGDVHRMRDKI